VRQALEAAIDRKVLSDVVSNGENLPGNQWVSPKSPYYQEKYPVPAATWQRRKSSSPTPVAVDFMIPNHPESRQAGEVLRAMAGEAGFDLKIRVTEFATSINEAEQGRFQAYFVGSSGRIDPDSNSYAFLKCGAPLNNGRFCNADVDRWLEQSREVSDLAARKASFEKIAGVTLEQGPIIYLYHPLIIIAHTGKLKGYTQLPDGLVRVVGVSLEP